MNGGNDMKARARRIMSYFGHVIWQDSEGYFEFAKGDGTDYVFDNIHDAMRKIEEIKNNK